MTGSRIVLGKPSSNLMKKFILLVPALAVVAMFISACESETATTTTTTRETSTTAVRPETTQTQTTTTRAGGY
jgi:hypothetical protein